jgi:SAM-dependent methyltransferase
VAGSIETRRIVSAMQLGLDLDRLRTFAWSAVSDPTQFIRSHIRIACPICGFVGHFRSTGYRPIRQDARCPKCLSLERHRLLWLALHQGGTFMLAGKDVLHVAPEAFIRKAAPQMRSYKTGDFSPWPGVDMKIDLCAIDLPDASYDAVIANHVLEHVPDDMKAMREVFRVLRPGGLFVVTVPQVLGWERTFEDPSITTPRERSAYFGQWDHVRLYGRDIEDRLRAAGFAVATFQASQHDEVRHGILKGDTVYFATRDVRPSAGEG